MYQRPQKNNTDIKPKTRNEAITEIVGMFAVNWPRYDNDSWPQQMAKLLRASFKTTHPNTIIKAGWHVLQKMTDDYPPSMGKIVKFMESFIGSGAAKSPKAEQCHKCNAGFILVSFWTIQNNVSYQQSAQCACDCDYGKKRQSLSVPFRDFISLNVNHPQRYIGHRFETWQKDLGLWVQGETYKIDEIPTCDEDTVRNSSQDLPPLSYNEIGLDETIKQRRQQLHIGESREQRAERLSNIGVEMQKAIKQLANKMAIPVPNDFEQLEHQDDDDSISDDSTEDMPETYIDHQPAETYDIQEGTKQTFDDEFDWSWNT